MLHVFKDVESSNENKCSRNIKYDNISYDKLEKYIWGTSMLHVHILSWVLAIILFIATYMNYSKTQGASPYYKPLHIALRLFMLLTLISGFWELIEEFMATSHGDGNHMLLTLKMLCGLAVI